MVDRPSPGLPSGLKRRGFTLIEVLVVVIVIGIVSSIVLISLTVVGDDRDVEREARRMGSLIELAADEAELQGRDFGIEFIRQGYRFVEYDPVFERWTEVVGDDLLRPRTLAEDFELDLYLEDRRIELAEQAADTEVDEEEPQDRDSLRSALQYKYAPHGLILSSGDLSPFELAIIRRPDDAIVRVRVLPDGSVQVGDENEDEAGD